MNSLLDEVNHRLEERIKILNVLDRASSYCSLQYIASHTDIPHPLFLLERLEDEGLVYRCKVNDWSASGHPLFKLKVRPDEADTRALKIKRNASN